jgi:hypothetical protein
MFVNFVDRRILLSPTLNERPAGSQPSDDVLMIGELVAQIEALIHAEPEATVPGFSSVSIQSRWVL